MEEERKVNVVKLGEFPLSETSVLVVTKTDYSGEDKVDFRVWVNSMKYKGPTKQGFVITMEKMDEFIKLVSGMKEKLISSEKDKKAEEKIKPKSAK